MKVISISKNRKFENNNSLVELLEENGYMDFEIGESPSLSPDELGIKELEDVLDPNEFYLAHTGIIGEDDSIYYSMVTTGYDDDVYKRYRPLAFVKTTEFGDMETLLTFEEK